MNARLNIFGLFIIGLLSACATTQMTPVSPVKREGVAQKTTKRGKRSGPGKIVTASYYGSGFAGRKTASGERFDPRMLTAAHKTLPFGTRVRVTNLRTGRAVVVRINDRGPYAGGREIDLSQAAARRIGMQRAGVQKVRMEILEGQKKK